MSLANNDTLHQSTLRGEIVAAGIEISNWCSDLYFEVTPESSAILSKYALNWANATKFICEITGKLHYDVPFAYYTTKGVNKMRSITVNFEDGNQIHTNINGTNESIKKHYIGESFDFGDSEEHPKSKMVKAIEVIFHDELNDDLKKVAAILIKHGFNDAYIESVLWGKRGLDTGMRHIKLIIKQARESK